jgi:hypothetical protein
MRAEDRVREAIESIKLLLQMKRPFRAFTITGMVGKFEMLQTGSVFHKQATQSLHVTSHLNKEEAASFFLAVKHQQQELYDQFSEKFGEEEFCAVLRAREATAIFSGNSSISVGEEDVAYQTDMADDLIQLAAEIGMTEDTGNEERG